jgi:hypothetical protein
MVVVLSSHVVSTGLNYQHLMTGAVLLSSIAEGKCTKLKNNHALRRTNITFLDDMSNYTNISFLCVRLLIWKPVAFLKSVIFLGNCGCVVVGMFLGVPSPINGCC